MVIPTYNYARFLPAAVSSALAQTHTPLEVLVVDDGSTDETAAVLQPYAGRIRVIRKANAGLSAARNTGIQEAQYPLLVFLDADDVLEPMMVARLLATLQALPPRFGLVACDARRIGVTGEPLPQRRYGCLLSREVTAAELIISNRFSPAVLVRRAVFQACGGFDERLRSSEDRDMWIRVAAQFGVYAQWEPLVGKRVHGANMSHHGERQSATMRAVLRKAWQAAAVPRWRLDFWVRAAAIYFFQSALMAHDEGHRFTAVRKLLASVLCWPWFGQPGSLEQPAGFRARALARSLLGR